MWKTSGAREGGPGRSGGRVEGVGCVSICKDVVDLIVKCTDYGQQEEEEQGHDRDVLFFVRPAGATCRSISITNIKNLENDK